MVIQKQISITAQFYCQGLLWDALIAFLWIILITILKTIEDAIFALQQFNRIAITKMSERIINADIKVSASIAVANIALTYL